LSTKYVDDTFDSTPFIDSTWLCDDTSISSQREVIVESSSPPPESTHTLSSSSTILPSQRETFSSPIAPRSGWNHNHHYETRFRQWFTAFTTILDNDNTTPSDESLYSAFISVQDSYPIHSSSDISFLEHIACAAPSNPDVLHYGSMLRDSDRSEFEHDMRREMSDLLRTDTVEITHRKDVPFGLKILSVMWSFRRKRAPDWSILKHKARLCPHGGQQIEGEHFWETYAPVVNWRTVRLVLILSLLSDLQSRQIDYVNAFTQAPADCDIFMSIPAGFIVENGTLVFNTTGSSTSNKDYVLRIKKNMYGLRQAGNNWFDALCASLLRLGFHQSCHDPCLFIRGDCILLTYVDDCLLFAKTDDVLDSVLAALEKEFILTSQGSVGAYLGIDIRRTSEGFLELVQPGLIQKIISACGLQDQSTEHSTPATVILTSDLEGPAR
jgi:hypothetical protein